tara:strand:- start:933 stop:1373 length:441 start_codon:yes stop_codon:yes gene_type:complete
MKRKTELRVALFLATITIATVSWLCITHESSKPSLDDFYHAVAQVESNGDDLAVGNHAELGRYQITYDFWVDSMEYADIGGTFDSCRLPEYSKMIMQGYYRRYANKAWHEQNFYDLARIHHGGWNGRNRIHTIEYAERVVALMGAE